MKRQKQTRARDAAIRVPGVEIPSRFTPSSARLLRAALIVLTLAAGAWYVLPMTAANGFAGFPLDDAWIAQAFARTLHETGRYALTPDAPTVSGVTAPLHVVVLTALRALSTNGPVLAWILGIASFVALGLLQFSFGRRMFPREEWVAALAALLLVLLPRMHSEAVAGMPTLLYTALVVGAAAAYFARKPVPFFVAIGVALWVRPDALVFLIAAVMHIVYHHGVVRKAADPSAPAQPASARHTVAGGVLLLVLIGGYALFNLSLGAGFFPNSVVAKRAWFGEPGPGYWQGVWAFFTRGAGAVLLLFAVIECAALLRRLLRREQAPLLMAALYTGGTVAAYALLLPVLPDGGRYLVPVLPFFILLALGGLRDTASFLVRFIPAPFMRVAANGIGFLVMAVAAITALAGAGSARADFHAAVRYIDERQVAAGRWLSGHTARAVRVATHQPGAIGYFGGRAVLDFSGVVSPEFVPAHGDVSAIATVLRGARIDYIAALREQFEVVNATPVFTSDPRRSEVMEITPTAGGRTHLMLPAASALNARAVQALQVQQPAAAVQLLRRSIQADPSSSRTMSLLGLALMGIGDTNSAVTAFRQALRIHPDYAQVMTPLGDILMTRGERREGLALLRRATALNPESFTARQSLERALEQQRVDSLEARGIHTQTITFTR